jgi:hypothetical protein
VITDLIRAMGSANLMLAFISSLMNGEYNLMYVLKATLLYAFLCIFIVTQVHY